jgi:ATP-binding cassette subfamily C protein CydC
MSATLRKLLGLMSPFFGRMLAAVVLGFLTIASGIGLMSTSAYIIARAALRPPLAELQVAIAGVRAFGIARGLLRYAERLLTHDTALRILSRLRVWIYDRIETLAPGKFEAYRSGDLLARLISDVDTLENLFVRALSPSGTALLTGLVMSLFVATIHPNVALIFLLFYCIAAIIIPWISYRLTADIGSQLVVTRSEMFITILDGLQGGAELLVFNQAGEHQRKLDGLTAGFHRTQHRAAWGKGFTTALSTFIANLSIIALTAAVVPLIRSGTLTGIDLAVILLGNLASYEAVSTLPAAYQELNRDLAAGKRLFNVAAGEKKMQPGESTPIRAHFKAPRIEFQDVSYSYPGRPEPALRDISLKLLPGESVGLVGPSGSGKTTLTEILLGLRRDNKGVILIDGHDLRSYDPDDVRRNFGVMPQRPFFFNSTLRENLLIADPEAADDRLIGVMQLAQLNGFLKRLPAGLDTIVGEHGYQLSAGERQRLSIARALLKAAPILIMDEATTHLDLTTEARLWRALEPTLAVCSSLIISHHMTVLEGCRQILVLDQGRIVERGSYHELLQRDGWFARTRRSEQVDQAMLNLRADS